MNLLALTSASIAIVVGLAAQTPNQSLMQPSNYRWVAQGRHAGTGNWYGLNASQPPGFTQPAGVAAGTRVWLHVPQARFQGGHKGTDYCNITGMAQNIIAGAAVTNFPVAAGHLFATGLAPAVATTASHGFEHATMGSDIVYFPSAPFAFPVPNNNRLTFALTTPVPVPKTEVVLFVEYSGGEYRESTTNGQTICTDWWGGGTAHYRGVLYAGFSEGSAPRIITSMSDPNHIPQFGMIIEEPVLTATGFHANRYYTPPMPQETYQGIGGAFPDYATKFTSANGCPCPSTLFFDIRGGLQFSNGQAVVLTDFAPFSFPAAIPTPFGNLLVNPANPLLTILSGSTLFLNNMGTFDQGPANVLSMPLLDPATIGAILKFQAVLADVNFTTLQLSSASTMTIF